MYEHGKILLFKPGDKVMAQHPRSVMNLESRKLYDNVYGHHMKNNIQEAKENQQKKGGTTQDKED